MLEYFTIGSAIISVITGLIVMGLGDWRKFILKFSGVALSTIATACAVILIFISPQVKSAEIQPILIFVWGLDQAARNISFILLYIANGRDAIHLSNRERRKTGDADE